MRKTRSFETEKVVSMMNIRRLKAYRQTLYRLRNRLVCDLCGGPHRDECERHDEISEQINMVNRYMAIESGKKNKETQK